MVSVNDKVWDWLESNNEFFGGCWINGESALRRVDKYSRILEFKVDRNTTITKLEISIPRYHIPDANIKLLESYFKDFEVIQGENVRAGNPKEHKEAVKWNAEYEKDGRSGYDSAEEYEFHFKTQIE